MNMAQEYQGMEDEELDDEELEELKKNDEAEDEPIKQKKKTIGRPLGSIKNKSSNKNPSPSMKNNKPRKSQESDSNSNENKRFVVFSQPARLGIADAETKEVIGEGEIAILDTLANILERLERIENTIGAILPE